MDGWYRLRVAGLKDGKIKALMKLTDDYDELLKVGDVSLLKTLKSKGDLDLLKKSTTIDLEEEGKKLGEVEVYSLKEQKYPLFLKNIAKPPVFIYVKGNLKESYKSIGIVGTRSYTRYGKNVCEKIADELAQGGVTIVSGLARGIDSIAHKQALKNHGYTIAVVGSGLDIIYPPENKGLWQEIVKKGAIISEFPLGTEPFHYNFPKRNRIIAGLSKGVVVIESKTSGGSLITAKLAFDENRDIFAVPGDIYSLNSQGTNQLIRDGLAKLVTSGEEILKEYGWDKEVTREPLAFELSKSQERIYNQLDHELNLDELIMKTKIPPSELLANLMEMELQGLIDSVAGGRYRKKILITK